MKNTLLCNSKDHPILPSLHHWADTNLQDHDIEIVETINGPKGGDILFLISCSEKIGKDTRELYRKTLVIHASDLPLGRGWSPHVWDIVDGATAITVTLLEAEDAIDSGKIWHKIHVPIAKHALWHELNAALFAAELKLLSFALDRIDSIEPQVQNTTVTPTYRRRRTCEDSRISPEKSIADQFDLLRVCDPERYPAFFDYLGQKFFIKLVKADE